LLLINNTFKYIAAMKVEIMTDYLYLPSTCTPHVIMTDYLYLPSTCTPLVSHKEMMLVNTSGQSRFKLS